MAERPAGSLVIRLLPALPGRIPESIKDVSKVIKPLSPEEQQIKGDLRRRYDHFGGEPRNYPLMLNLRLGRLVEIPL